MGKGLSIINQCLQSWVQNYLNTFQSTVTTSNTTIANTITKDVTCILIALQILLTNAIEIDVLKTSQYLEIIHEYDYFVRKGGCKVFWKLQGNKKSINNIESIFVIAIINT